ncbi:MAG: tetratricopeptide repeat protein [Parvularculaceae bacterium]|nr:tetratricopeptide repeat protein [Parvularculaceae bacterium]
MSLAGVLAVFASATTARADQTDPLLDDLFATLRASDGVAAGETVGRILDVWSKSQSDTVNLLDERAFASATDGDYPLALALSDHVVGLAPHFAQGYALRGVVKARLGDAEGAEKDFRKTLLLEPRQFEASVALADLLLASGRTRDAFQLLQDALKWNPHDRTALDRARAVRDLLARQDT